MPLPWFRKGAREPAVTVQDPRFEDWETVSSFEDVTTALAWRDQLRGMGIDASLTADQSPDRFGRGDVYLVVPGAQYSAATEILDNLE